MLFFSPKIVGHPFDHPSIPSLRHNQVLDGMARLNFLFHAGALLKV